MKNTNLIPRHSLMRCIFTTGALGCLLCAFLVVTPGCSKSARETPSIKVGLGETIITPFGNFQMSGFARSQVSTGVHDDLHARCLVLEDKAGNTAVLMSISVSGLNDEFAACIREGISAKTIIPGENIVISCTHTHAGPAIGRDNSTTSLEYRAFLIEKCVESAVNAWNTRTPGKIGIEATEVFELGRNRRALGYGGIHPDPRVAVIKIQDRRDRLIGVAFNYGCHPSGLDWMNTEFSEDWPYYAIRGIKKGVGENVWVAFFQGAEGNINVGYTAELSAVGAQMPIRSHWYIEKKGIQMAEVVLKVLPDIKTSGECMVKTAYDLFDYPMRESYPVTLEQAEKDARAAQEKLAAMEKIDGYKGTRSLDKVRVEVFSANQRLNAANRFYAPGRSLTRKNEQQAVRIGDAVFVTYTGGLFSEIGLEVKKRSPLEKTFIIGECAGRGGYLPMAKDFIDGDYEVDGTPYSPKAEDTYISTALELIGRVIK